ALGIPGTALAYLLFFALVNGPGAAYAALVTYLIPPIALAYGAIFLGERFGCGARGSRSRWTDSLGRVSRSYVIYIGLLAAFWGASYMFIKVADRAYEPATMMMLRLLVAALIIVTVLAVQRGWDTTVAEMRALGWEGFVLGVVNGAIPFTLIAWGEKYIDS